MKWSELKPAAINPMWSVQQGIPGVDGRNGKDGRDGVDGIDGANAESFKLKGRWNRIAHYKPLDLVSYFGSSWICVEKHSNKRPTDHSKFWQLLAAKGSKGDRGPSGFGQRGCPGKDAVSGNAPLEIEFAGNFTKGQVIYVDDNSIAQLAQADAESTTGAVGFVTAQGQYITEGQIEIPNLMPGDVYYLSTTTAGSITNSPTTPGTYVVALGRAIGPNTLDIEIQLPILLTGNTTVGSANQVTEVFTITNAQELSQQIKLSASPSQASVFLSGLLLTEGEIYSLIGSTIEFTCLAAGDFFVVKY